MVRLLVFLILFLVSFIIKAQDKPAAFLPELFKDYPNVRDIAIAPDGNKIYFTVDGLKSKVAVIAFITKQNNGWSKPKTVSFTGNYRDLEPAFSQDGKRLYFVSNRPAHKDSIQPKDYDIWYVDKIKSGWSKPKNLGQPINTEANEFYPSLTKNGTLYFTSARKGTKGNEDIFVSAFKNGQFQEPISVSGGVNTKYYEFNAFVDPDERYLIFSSHRPNEGQGGSDLYISYQKDGLWQKATLLKNVNSPALDFCPFVDSKTNRFYFTSQRTQVKRYYKKRLDIDWFLNMYQKGSMGLNRVYYINFSDIAKKKY